MPFVRLVVVTVAVLAQSHSVLAQDSRLVFEGRPIRKLQASVAEVLGPQSLTAEDAFRYQVRIVERDGKYYWASREMKQLARVESGAYLTFIALDGSGYVRIGSPELLALRDQLPASQRREEIGYTEHLLTQFASITYFGNQVGAKP